MLLNSLWYSKFKNDSHLSHLVYLLPLLNNQTLPLLFSICTTRRVLVQRAVERDEIRYPYKVHDAASPIKYNYKIDHSRA